MKGGIILEYIRSISWVGSSASRSSFSTFPVFQYHVCLSFCCKLQIALGIDFVECRRDVNLLKNGIALA